MSTTRRGRTFAALAVGLSLIAAACGGDDEDTTTPATEAPEATDGTETTEAPGTTEASGGETTEAPGTTEAPAGDAAMRITYDIADTAVWDDGTPITAADFVCTYEATMNTPASLSTTGYDQIVAIAAGESDKQVVVDFSTTYAPYKTLFANIIKADVFDDCNDVSEAFGPEGITFSGSEWKLDSWSAEQIVYVPNPEYQGPRTPGVDKVVIVPAEDGTTALKAGTVDFIFPQAYTGIDQELADPNIAFDAQVGGSYEGLYFQQLDGPFADKDFRTAFMKSIDLDGLYAQIYAPFAQGIPLLDCGPITNPNYCDGVFADTYDPEGAKALLEGAGWTLNGEGLWQNADGEVPEIRWMVNTGNTRRESSQEYLIPLLKEAGFNVRADNCEAVPCVFQTRLPALDYDLAMYINTVAPDPTYLVNNFACDQIPTEENDFAGQNNVGWCNEEASDLIKSTDYELDEATRTENVKTFLQYLVDDAVMLPTLAFPNIGAYRTDKVANTQGELANYQAINDWYQWEDVDGDGQIVIGAEQFPTNDCTNPITECANSSWFYWLIQVPVLPGAFRTTNDQTFEVSEMLAGEPTVEVF